MRGDGLVVAWTCSMAFALPALGQATFTPLGFPSVPVTIPLSAANGVSDGAIVVGATAIDDTGRLVAFRWEDGVFTLLVPEAHWESSATDISRNGRVICGTFTATENDAEAVFWTEDEGMVGLGFLPNASPEASATTDISDDGSIIVGSGYPKHTPGFAYQACKWDATGIVQLKSKTAPPTASNALGVSHDGRVIVGWYNGATSVAFRWTWQTGMVALPTMFSRPHAVAYAANADGSVVVGYIYLMPNASDRLAVVWPASGGVRRLGTLPDDDLSHAWDVSADGNVIVGTSGDDPEAACAANRAFYWSPATRMVELQLVLDAMGANIPEGWKLTTARAISSDGKTIVGTGCNPAGQNEAWIATLP